MSLNVKNVRFNIIDSPNPKLVQVKATFIYDGLIRNYYVFIIKRDDFTSEDYLNKAEEIFYKKVKNIPKIKRSSPALVTLVSCFIVAAIAVGGFFTYKALTRNPYTPGAPVEVKVDIPDLPMGYQVELSNLEAKVNEKYETKITLVKTTTNEDNNYRLPDTLDKVTSYKTDLVKEQYTYTYKNETEANLSIEGNYVFGPINIKLTLVEVPGPAPFVDYDIILSDDCIGVTLPSGQTVRSGSTTSFEVKIDPMTGYDKPITISNILIGTSHYIYPNDYNVTNAKDNIYTITFNKPASITTNIIITARAEKIIPPGTMRTINFNSVDFDIYDVEGAKLSDSFTVDANLSFVGYVKPKTTLEDNKHHSLGVEVNSSDQEKPLSFAKDYKYRFVDEEEAEITIPRGTSTITINPKTTTAAVEFIYHAEANSSANITFAFEGSSFSTSVNWGDDSEEIVGYKLAFHTFTNETNVAKDYLIGFSKDGSKRMPRTIGFSCDPLMSDIMSVSDYKLLKITPYCSGIRNITGVRFTNGISSCKDGFAYTSIDSIYLPANFTISEAAFSYCNNLEKFYVNEGSIYSLNENGTIVYKESAESRDVCAVANVETLRFETSDNKLINIAACCCYGLNRLTSLYIGKTVNCFTATTPFIDCPNLKEISVDKENENFVTDIDGPINALIMKTTIHEESAYKVENVISTTNMELLNDYDRLIIGSFAFCGVNSYDGDLVLSKENQVVFLSPYSFYNCPIKSITFGEGSVTYLASSAFYNCQNLTSLSFNYLCDDNVYYYDGVNAIIQKCPCVKLSLAHVDETMGDFSFYLINGALYLTVSQTYQNQGPLLAILIATSYEANIVDSFKDKNNNEAIVVYFAEYVFDGNNVSDIYIPENIAELSGCFYGDISATFSVSEKNPYFEAVNARDGSQSILYAQYPSIDYEMMFAATIAKNNHTLHIPDTGNDVVIFNAIGDNDNLEEVIFDFNDISKCTFYGRRSVPLFYKCYNLKTVDFTTSQSGEAPILEGEINIFTDKPFYKLVTLKVRDQATVDAFTEVGLDAYNLVTS